MNPVPGFGNVDLRLTGAFQEALKADVSNIGIHVYSTDEKSQMLQAKYGSSVFTLFGEWKQDFIKELTPVFRENVEVSLTDTPF